MQKTIRRFFYRIYIRWLALQWIGQINLGDAVWHKGRIRYVSNGVHDGCWTLTEPWQQFVPRKECRKVMSFANLYGSYKSGVRFYTGYWLSIWVDQGIRPWMRGLHIWPGGGSKV